MPNHYDFTQLINLKEVELNLSGYINPITIEYGIGDFKGISSYYWRIKGTLHTFTIPILRMDFISKGNYKDHFSKILTSFREEYIEWYKSGLEADWMKEYYEEYKNTILL